MRTKEELENAIKVYGHYRNTLPEFSMLGDRNWEKDDNCLYYLNCALNNNSILPLESEDGEIDEVYTMHEWLSGYDGSDFYSDILEELAEL